MSQAGIINVSGGGGGGSPVETLTGDTGGAVPPTANNINILGGTVTSNNNNGILVAGNPGTSTLTVELTNRITGSVTTSNATPTTLATFSLGATPAVFTFDIEIACFNTTDINGDGYSIFATARTTGAAANLCGTPDKVVNEEVADTADANLVVSGNNVIVQVTGIAGKTHNWRVVATYVQVI